MRGTIDFQQLVATAGDAIIVSDAAGNIVMWNPASERIFGFTEDDAIGGSLDIIIPERQRGRHWDGYHQTMATGVTRYGTELLRVPALHKDGRTLSIAFTVSLLSEGDTVTGIVAIVRDETQRWTEERELRRRVRDLETELRAKSSS
ncbi:PAS domain S-box protein [Methylobrevis pamukkalensis]|nr:PAS domain S-box protein [Methylobrevis pamukkalensis]